jgi:hypothetical protein
MPQIAMDSVMCILPEAHHGLEKKEDRKNLLDLMKIEMQCCLNATARNRWLLCFMLMDDEAISTPGCTS